MSDTEQKEYGAGNIKILEGLAAVRQVPSMYIGNTGVEGFHHMVYELVDNGLDEVLAGYADKVSVTIHPDNSVTVEDNGRGIPVAIHPDMGVSALEVVLSVLHAGGKFDKDTYKFSAGLHGVGLSVVTGLSEYIEAEVYREGKVWYQRYEQGVKKTEVKVIGETKKTGTKIRFRPDAEIFEISEFNYDILANRMRDLSFLNNGVHIIIKDERKNKIQEFKHAGGIPSFVTHLTATAGKAPLFETPVYVRGSKPPLDYVEVAFQHNEGYNESVHSFVNNVNTHEGGSHVAGFKSALTRSLNNCSVGKKLLAKGGNLTGDDVKEGLLAVISIRLADPQFEGQTKGKLGNSNVKGLVETVANDKLGEYLEDYPAIAEIIINKAMETRMAREAARKAKEQVRSKSVIGAGILPGKLADCQEHDPAQREIFIVEGDSAGGSAKQGRSRKTQAILPLKGKILNVEKAELKKIDANLEIKALHLALGVNGDNSVEGLRYHKVIIMTDADVDGAHIRTLLLTFFYRAMPAVIENGFLYIAQPPLYRVSWGKQGVYMKDDPDLSKFVLSRGADKVATILDGVMIDPAALKEDLSHLMAVEDTMRRMNNRGTMPRHILLAFFAAGISTREDMETRDRIDAAAREIDKHGYETGIEFDPEHSLFKLSFKSRDNDKAIMCTVDYETVSSGDYKEAHHHYEVVSRYYTESLRVNAGVEDMAADSFLAQVTAKGKDGINIQRYKGLGEMNPEQLWETTMDPEKRSMLKVTMDDAIVADQVFTMLMGNSVESRKAFITENAIYVSNLDV